MYDPRYQLITDVNQPKKSRLHLWTPRLFVAVLLIVALAFSTLYGPILWGNQPVSANTGFQQIPDSQLVMDTSLLAAQDALANLYDYIAPSVVSIQVTTGVQASPFGLPRQGGGQGSGWIYDNDGHIVTNNHVVEDAQSITVIFNNGLWADAELVARDPQADLAVIKVDPPTSTEWRPLPLADPHTLRVGHSVIAVGNPFGLDSTMTTGIVSALGRGQPIGEGESTYTLPDIIQTDAAINPGNSGGPLLNLNGEVVGVNFAIRSASGSNSGVGFTIPVSIVRRVVPALISDGHFNYPFLGLSGRTIDPMAAEALNLPDNQLGVYVASVVGGGPSEDAGVRGGETGGGDIVVAIDGHPVYSFEDMVGYLVTETSPEQTVTLRILRDGEELELNVVLGYRPGAEQLSRAAQESQEINARQAIEIALDAVQSENLIAGEIAQKVAVPDEVNGEQVWVVELTGANQKATVTINRATGDVLEVVIE